MKTFIQGTLSRIEVVIDFINGVDRSAFQPKTLSAIEMDAMHQTMMY
jgi:hypothetical protein